MRSRAGAGEPGRDMEVEERARTLLREVEAQLKPLSVAANLADWEATTTGTREAQEAAASRESALRHYLSSPDRYRQILELLDSDRLHDPILRRQLVVLALNHRPNQLATEVLQDLVRRAKEIEGEFYSFRAELDGRPVTDNEIIEILRTERDVKRRKAAWEASKQIAPRIAGRLLELVRRRNDAARSLGFRDFYAMRMELQEIDEQELLKSFYDLKTMTDEPYRAAKARVDRQLARRYGVNVDDLRPWHYEDPYFQEPPLSQDLGLDRFFRGGDPVAIADRFFTGVELPVHDVLDRSDLEERPGKDQHAYCTDIDREGDIRVLCNLQDDERWMGILLHELGHAAYDKFIPRSLPWLLRRPAHTATTEAIAMFMDRLVYDADWLSAMTRRSVDDDLARRAAGMVRFESLLMARWVPVMTFFERELYANPEPDGLNQIWWSLVEELQLVRRPADRSAPDWAAKIHLTVAPVYYHNYLLGELIASQLKAAIDREALGGAEPAGYVGRRELGQFLRERVFAFGARLQWQSHLEKATGSRLDLEPFRREFLGGVH